MTNAGRADVRTSADRPIHVLSLRLATSHLRLRTIEQRGPQWLRSEVFNDRGAAHMIRPATPTQLMARQ